MKTPDFIAPLDHMGIREFHKYSALAVNRTPVSRVAGENSTTEPPALYVEIQFPSMKAGRRRTFIAKIIGEFNFTNILRWR